MEEEEEGWRRREAGGGEGGVVVEGAGKGRIGGSLVMCMKESFGLI